jgi:hypothetical protein
MTYAQCEKIRPVSSGTRSEIKGASIVNHNLFAIVGSAVLCTACAVTAAVADSAVVSKAIQSQYDRGIRAINAKDGGGYGAICTADAVFTVPHKAPKTLKEMEADLSDSDGDVVARQTIRSIRLDRGGRSAEVETEITAVGTTDLGEGSPGPGDKTHKWSMVVHTADLWLKRNNVWRLKKSVMESPVFRLDGKVMP